MPELSRFYGIVIRIHFNDHPPPHFHAEYGEYKAVISINTLAVVAGRLPARALGLAIEWASLHQEALHREWDKAQSKQSVSKIPPLK